MTTVNDVARATSNMISALTAVIGSRAGQEDSVLAWEASRAVAHAAHTQRQLSEDLLSIHEGYMDLLVSNPELLQNDAALALFLKIGSVVSVPSKAFNA